ncbi:MAG: Asp/Glu/hydantoin racemase [Parasphingorhabdus sp.]|jgi:Asp/Glu/hydantoin racemase
MRTNSEKVSGGKTVYGASVGILMLEARFPRILGDMGNAQSWPFPVLYKVVEGASPNLVVRNSAQGLLEQFILAGKELVRNGADGVTTNCGFLSLFQKELSFALQVPVATSSLMQVPLIQSTLPETKRVSILTISSSSLTERHLSCAGCKLDTPVESTEGGKEFSRAILDNELEMDIGLARLDNIEAAERLMRKHPETGAIVLECTNMVPYAADIRRATGVPVYTIFSFISWFQSGLSPEEF